MFPIPPRLPFTLQSHTGSPTGYAETATLLMGNLIEQGVEVHYLCVNDDVIYEAPSYNTLVNQFRKVEPEGEPIQVLYSIAPLFWHNSGKYRVGWSMMEVDRLSARWVRACNVMDEVWVPTPLNREAFVLSGVKVPVRVVPLGIDVRQFQPNFLPFVYHGDHTFRFVAVGWWQLRKRWDLLVQAFAAEFGREKNVGLICKIMTEDGPDMVVGQIHGWIGSECDEQIAVVDGGLPWWELVGILRSCHAFVLPTSGEGYGCPPVQALACGLPVITTDCMGPGEVLRGWDGRPFPGVRLVSAGLEPCGVQHEYYAEGRWWVPDVDDLRAAMREVYENHGAWSDAAQVGSVLVRERCSGEAMALAVKAELTRIYKML